MITYLVAEDHSEAFIMKIPIVIGVTGHRDLRQQDIPILRRMVRAELEKLKNGYPHSELVMLNSLASGADSLCAEEALPLGFRLVCPLPLPVEEYRKDFDEAEIRVFERLLSSAESVFVAPDLEPERPDRDFRYRQAGLFVASHCHGLLSLWDGSVAKPDGCGTAEIVAFKLDGCRTAATPLNADAGAVLQIVTPRMKNAVNPEISVQLWEKEPGQFHDILTETDAYNRNAAAFTPENAPEPLLPEECLVNTRLKRLSELYAEADGLSLFFQKRYLYTMRGFAITGVLLILFFLLYDTGESNLFLFGYGSLLLIYFLSFLFVKKQDAHGKYLNYRLLAETARIQTYLTSVNAEANVGCLLTWTQKQESAWIRAAMDVLTADAVGCNTVDENIVRHCWIDSQLAYHEKAGKRDGKRKHISEKTAQSMLTASILLTFVLLLFELFGGSLMETPLISSDAPSFLLQHTGQDFTLRSFFKLLLGIISSVTVFLADYYGRLSLDRKTEDHEKMARLYREAAEQFENHPSERTELLISLAQEEIIENGNWVSYCRENPPSFDV